MTIIPFFWEKQWGCIVQIQQEYQNDRTHKGNQYISENSENYSNNYCSFNILVCFLNMFAHNLKQEVDKPIGKRKDALMQIWFMILHSLFNILLFAYNLFAGFYLSWYNTQWSTSFQRTELLKSVPETFVFTRKLWQNGFLIIRQLAHQQRKSHDYKSLMRVFSTIMEMQLTLTFAIMSHCKFSFGAHRSLWTFSTYLLLVPL